MQLSNRRRTLTLATVASMLWLTPSPVLAVDWTPGRYMSQAIVKIVSVGTVLQQRNDFGWNGTGLCLLGAYLQPSGQVELNMHMVAGHHYAFVAATAGELSDLDLEIFADRRRLASDTQTDGTPVVEFRPPVSRQYTLRLKLYASTAATFAAVAILEKSAGFTVPVKNLADAYLRNIRLAESANTTLRGARYHDYDNQWALFGQVLRPNAHLTVSSLNFESGSGHYVLVSGDSNAQDLDLAIHQGDRLVARDNEPDATPVAGFRTSGANHAISITNQRSRGATLAIASVLDAN